MYIQPRSLCKQVTSYDREKLKQKRLEQNLARMGASRIKVMPKSLFGLNHNLNAKGNDKEKNNIGHVVNGDGDNVPSNIEKRLSSDRDSGDLSRGLANKVKGTCPRKETNSTSQTLRKPPRIQEEGGNPQGLAEAEHLPASPLDQTDIHSKVSQHLKRKRGPTKLKTIAIHGGTLIDVMFDEIGQPIGDGSVKLSSFLGALVREIVPYTLSDWRKLPSGMAEVLWQSIKVDWLKEEADTVPFCSRWISIIKYCCLKIDQKFLLH